MTTWASGRESGLLDDIIAGRKTIEGRLNRGKFADYKVGDTVKLRRDVRGPDGVLRDGEPAAAQVRIIAIRQYASFAEMTVHEDYKKIIPSAKNANEAAEEYNRYYSQEDQNQHGVLAIEISAIE